MHGVATSKRNAFRRLYVIRRDSMIADWLLALIFVIAGLASFRFHLALVRGIAAATILGLAVWDTAGWQRLVRRGRYSARDVYGAAAPTVIWGFALGAIMVAAIVYGGLAGYFIATLYLMLSLLFLEPTYRFFRSCLALLENDRSKD